MPKNITGRLPFSILIVLFFVLGHLVFVLSKWHAVPLYHGLPAGQTDPDTWLRLTLVRDWLTSGNWYDHTVWRSNAPFPPISSPWTRPLDLIIRALVDLQPDTVDINLRLIRAGLLMPVLWMGLLLAGILRAIRIIMPLPSAYAMAAVLLITLQPMWNYFTLGNADHHAPMAALFVWIIGGVLVANPSRRLMLLTGLLFGLHVWISVEALILIAAVYAWYGIGWLRGQHTHLVALSWLATSLALTSLLAVGIERPMAAWFTPIYDSISIVHAVALLLCAALVWGLRLLPAAATTGTKLTATTLAGGMLLLAIRATYPHLLDGPMYGVDPYIFSDFLPRISEARPIYKVPLLQLLAYIITPLAAWVMCLGPWIRPDRRFYSLEHSAALAFFLLVTLTLYYCQQRWGYYLLPLSVMAMAPLLGALFTPEHTLVCHQWPANLLVGLSPNEQMKRRLPVTLALLGMPFMMMLASAAPDLLNHAIGLLSNTSDTEKARTAARDACYTAAHQLIRSGELARVLPEATTLLAPTDLGTEILFFSPHRIVASNYHREGAGIRYVWSADKLTKAAELRSYLAERHIGGVLLCPALEQPKGSVLQTYAHGAPLPQWLIKRDYELPPVEAAEKSSQENVPPLLLLVSPPRDTGLINKN